MKVLWIIPGYPWQGRPYGGVFFQTQAQALSRLGLELAILVPAPWIPRWVAALSPRHALQRSAPRHQVDDQVAIRRIPYFGHRFHQYLGFPHRSIARRVLASLPFRPDLVHGQMAFPDGLAAVEVARRLGVPAIVTLHGSDVNLHASRSALGARRFRQAVSGADRVLCVSQALREKSRLFSGVAGEYLPIGINLQRFPSPLSRAEAREALGLPPGRPVVLFIGNLLTEKGVSVALEALGHPSLSNVSGVFVGAGPLAPDIASRANCLWRDSVPNTRIPEFLSAADMLILPSFAEGLPTVLVEAGACRTPVIATEVGGIPELLTDERGLLIPPGSSEALREAILATLDDPPAAKARAERLHAHVLDAFDADRNAKQLMGIYQELTSF